MIVMSSSLMAQGRPSSKTYDCQMSRYSCDTYRNRHNVEITAYSHAMAVRKCKSLAPRRGMKYCAINDYENSPINNSFSEYRCQLTSGFCGYNGGRYGVWVKAASEYMAISQCQREARNRGDKYCRISEKRLTRPSGYNKYACHLSMRGCFRTTVSHINAYTYTEANRKCEQKATQRRKSMCKVVRL